MPTSKGFTGQRADAATSLDYYGARYYDPVLGQFTSADPAGDGLNLYAYVKGNPETWTDPTGLVTFGICVGVTEVLGIGGIQDACVVVGWSPTDGPSGGFTLTTGAGPQAGLGADVGIGAQFSTANTVDDLGGWFGYVNGGVAGEFGVDGTAFGGNDSKGRAVWGLEGQVTTGLDGHLGGGVSNTKVLDFNTIGSWFSQQGKKSTDWISQQVRTLTKSVDQHVGKAIGSAGQHLGNVASSAGRHMRYAGDWFDRQMGNATNWVGQQVGNATNWVGRQVGALGSWLGL